MLGVIICVHQPYLIGSPGDGKHFLCLTLLCLELTCGESTDQAGKASVRITRMTFENTLVRALFLLLMAVHPYTCF
jgi:hypothetical protein